MVQFNFIFDPNVTLEQRIGFEMAAAIWSTFLTDDISVNLRIGATTGLDNDQAVGGAVPIFHEQNYGVYQEYLAQDATSAEDATVVDSLQAGNTTDVLVNGELVDGNTSIMLTSAQAKALGMDEALVLDDGTVWDRDLVDSTALDGYIVLNESYDWNYDFARTGDAPEGTLDFLTMALHEIGHSLGFVSGIDGLLDTFTMHSGETRTEGMTALDLLRYSDVSAALENPDGAVADLTEGTDSYFSLDGGDTSLADFSTGQDATVGGDGYQASHWQRFQQAIGIMDPTLGYQERTDISYLDLQAFDVLGWDVDYAALDGGLDFEALQAQAQQTVAADFGVEASVVQTAFDNGQDWYTLGYGGWWQAFEEQMLELGYGGWWQQFEADLLAEGYPNWWQAFDQQLMELGYGGWWQAFEEKVLELGYGGWWQEFESSILDLGYGGWWQAFEPAMLELTYGGWWQQFESQMVALGYGGWWQEFENSLLELGYGGWWQAFEARALELGYGGWWQIFEETVLELGYGGWWQEFESSILDLGYGGWWQVFELGYGGWWQQIEQHINTLNLLEEPPTPDNPNGSQDVISGGNADDILAGGLGRDLISGAAGDDLLDGKAGNDLLLGDSGNDIVYGWDGEDMLFGGEGDDLLAGENDNDQVYGEAGHDILSGGRGDDQLYGGEGRDVLKGDTGNDVLDGGSGDDQLSGNTGDDLLIGGEGQDTVDGGSGNDVLYGDVFFAPVIVNNDVGQGLTPSAPPITSAEEAAANLDLWMRLEAEDMKLKNYNRDEYTGASNGRVIKTQGQGTATTTFTGINGTYDLVLGYADQASGTAEMTLVIKSKGIETAYGWQLDGSDGLGTHTISGVTLAKGDKIILQGTSDEDLDFAQLDYLDILTPGANAEGSESGGTHYQFVGGQDGQQADIRIEAEDMELGGVYSELYSPYASGDTVITNLWGTTGTATYTYTGAANTYNLYANYFDNILGDASATVLLNGITLHSWIFDKNDFATHDETLGLNVTLNAGDVIEIQGTTDWFDTAIIDYLVLEHVVASPPTPLPTGSLQIEVEHMDLTSGAQIAHQTSASGSSLVKAQTGNSFNATNLFQGETGYYDVVVGYYDHASGAAELNISIDNTELDRWFADQNLGTPGAHLVQRTVAEAVHITQFDLIEIGATEDGGDQGNLDYIQFIKVEAPIVDLPDPLRVEAETMTISGNVRYESQDFSSGGQLIKTSSSLTASTTFNGPAGLYNIVIGYYDENDGQSPITVSLDGTQLDSWVFDQDLGHNAASSNNFVTRTVGSAVSLDAGAVLELQASKNSSEFARIDYVEFVAVEILDNVGPAEEPTDSNTSQDLPDDDHGDVLRGGAGDDTAYGGADDDHIYGESGDDILYGDFGNANASGVTKIAATLSFQQGENGYGGTVDTFIDEYYGGYYTGFGASSSLHVDGNYGGYAVQGLLRFEDIFGNQAGQIGLTDDITSATLELNVSDAGNSLVLYEMLQGWAETDTWGALGNGIQANGLEADNVAAAVTDAVGTGILQIDVTDSLQAWQANPDANHGWAILPTGTDGVNFWSSETANGPRLVVEVNQSSQPETATDNAAMALPAGGYTNNANGHYYLRYDTLAGWEAAQAYAESVGGNLVTINDAAEEQWIKDTFGTADQFWTGLTDRALEGSFEWISGEAFTYSNWVSGEPNNAGGSGNADYVRMNYTDGLQWGDYGGDSLFYSIIEIDPGSGSNTPLVPSPEVASDLPDGWIYNGNFYTLSNNATWQDAQDEARSLGGNLVTINDAAENQWLLDTFGTQNDWLWTGLTDQNQEGQFEWVSGQAVTYTNWAPGQPHDDSNGSQDYAILNWNNQGWDDNQGDWEWQGIIEKELPLNISEGFVHNGSVYLLTDSAMLWTEAQAYAESLGGNLVTINDAAEDEWLKQTFGMTEALWTGFSDAETEGTWKWASGEESEWVLNGTNTSGMYVNWSPGQPDSYNGTEQDYAVLSHIWLSDRDDWDDAGSGASHRGIIEIKLTPESLGEAGNDILTGGSGHDSLYGEAGDDSLNGTDQVVAGFNEQDTLYGGAGADTFILGDGNQAYYSLGGLADFAVIKDFVAGVDTVQLHGVAGSYQQQQQGSDLYLHYGSNLDLIAKFEGITSLNLTSDVSFVV